MEFRDFMINEYARKLAKAYADILRDVPQSPEHHPEGAVLNHVRLVRKAISAAIEELKNLKSDSILGDVLANLDFNMTSEEMKILNTAAWLHDIGKFSSTTIDGIHFNSASNKSGKIQAIGHETPSHYQPQLDKLSGLAPKELVDFYETHKEIINFLIERHMDFAHGGFGKGFISNYFNDGRIKNDKKIKLLLVLMWADKMGRGKMADLADNILKLRTASEKSKQNHTKLSKQTKPFQGGEDDFRAMLRQKGLSEKDIEAAVTSKFGFR
jgi:hypothetical protein